MGRMEGFQMDELGREIKEIMAEGRSEALRRRVLNSISHWVFGLLMLVVWEAEHEYAAHLVSQQVHEVADSTARQCASLGYLASDYSHKSGHLFGRQLYATVKHGPVGEGDRP